MISISVLSGCTQSTSNPAVPSPEPAETVQQEPSTPPPAPVEPAPAPAPPVESQPQGNAEVLAAVESLEVKGRAPKTGYSRDQFGQSWADVDRNGCDTRNDILRRDLTNVTYKDNSTCVIATGTLEVDPYTGVQINWKRGQDTSSAVQIDHVVALSDSWQKGAQQWDANKREQFANDPLNLIAADGPANQSKGDGDTATWLPPNGSYRCEYVARQVAVKSKYGIWVTDAEKTAMVNVLTSCPNQPLPKDDSAEVVVPPRG